MLINNDNKSVWAHYYQEAGWEGDEGHGAGASLTPGWEWPWERSSGVGREPGGTGGTEGGLGLPSARPGEPCRVLQSDFVTLSESKDISESPPSSSTLGTQVLGGSGGHQGFGTSLRLHPWGCSGPAQAGWAQQLPDCPILFNLSLSPKTFYTGIFSL